MSGAPNTGKNSEAVNDATSEVESSEVTPEATDAVVEPEVETDASAEADAEASAEEETDADKAEVDVESAVFKAALTAEVEKTIGGRLAREREKITAAEAKATAAEDRVSTLEADLQTATADREAAEKARDEANTIALHLKLALKHKVSPELVKSLKGETEEELDAAIKAVSTGFKSVDRIFSGKDTTQDNEETLMVNDIQALVSAKLKT